MLLTTQVEITWNSSNKRIYTKKGYEFTAYGETFLVDIKDLPKGSHEIVEVLCDFCKENIVKKMYLTYNKQHHDLYGDCCCKCQPLKNKLVCLDKYGVDNGSKTPQAIENIKKTCLERYGVNNGAKTEEAREKISKSVNANKDIVTQKRNETIMNKYGVSNIMELSETKEKLRKTFREKYGVDHPKQNEEVKQRERENNIKKYGVPNVGQYEPFIQKKKQTCLKLYGSECCLSNLEIRKKGMETLIKESKVPTSKQQLELYEILSQVYSDCELNKPLSSLFLDCAIVVKGQPIDIEYDGIYWHKDKQSDRKRDEVVKKYGYKILRIVGSHSLPSLEEIKEKINVLVNTEKTFCKICVD